MVKRLITGILILNCIFLVGCVEEKKQDVLENQQEKVIEIGKEEIVVKQKEERMEETYKIFPKPPIGWVGDVMPMTDSEVMQFYYLQDWRDGAEGFHPIHKFSTTDLINYFYDGEVIPVGGAYDPDLAIGTGSIIEVDGIYHCFYTGHNPKYPDLGKNKECVMHAISTDNKEWTKVPEDTFLAPEGYEIHDFRDPFVFFNEEEGNYWMLLSARKEDLGGVVAKFTSNNLKTWEVQEPLYAPESYFMLECTDLFKMGDYWYLIFSEFSHEKKTHYVMSKSLNGVWEVPERDFFDGKAFYAAKSLEYEGKRYLAGWIPTKPEEKDSNNYEWAGNMSVLEIVQEADGTLSAKMPEQYNNYFINSLKIKDTKLIGDVQVEGQNITIKAETEEEIAGIILGKMPTSMLFKSKVVFDEIGQGAGFAVGIQDELIKAFGIHLDPSKGLIRSDSCVIDRICYTDPIVSVPFGFKEGVAYDLKLVVENDLVIIYINDELALSSRIYRMPQKEWGIFSLNGSVTFKDIEILIP